MKKSRAYIFVCTAMFLTIAFACQRPSSPSASKPGASTIPTDTPNSVFFRIQEVNRQKVADGEEVTWLATHESQGAVARFKIRMILKKASGDVPFNFSKGVFLRENDSQSTEFLRIVAKALEAPGKRKVKPKTDTLEFMVAIMGENLSRGSGPDQFAGAFTSKPAGDWLATKVFVADGEGEFFLNLNSKEGIGEISMKDPEYGDLVLAELERIL